MSANRELQKIFEQLAAGLQLLGDSSFRATSHARVGRLLRDMGEDVDALVRRDPKTAKARLKEIPGIGEGAARRILEYLDTGKVAQHEEMLEKVPEGLFRVLEIPGLGPKAVSALWQELGVESIDDLRAALDAGTVESVRGMGAKTVENLRSALEFRSKSHHRLPLGRVRPIADAIVDTLGAMPEVEQVAYAGSLRRGSETIGDVDLLVATDAGDEVHQLFVGLPGVAQVLAHGDTRSSVLLELDDDRLQVDLRTVDVASWGAALLYFTGSKEHNVRLREIAISQEKHLNEYGLYPDDGEPRPQDRGLVALASETEEDIYEELSLPYVAPELREHWLDPKQAPDDLIELSDIGAELHAHTTASDGKLTLQELVEHARGLGYHTLAITDHSTSAVIANGLDPERLLAHVESVRKLAASLTDFQLLAGAEVDILPDGSLDYDDDILEQLDLVIASPHVSLNQAPDIATERLVRAASHPQVKILGHLTGRKVGKREGLRPDLDRVLEAAAANDVALEVNANPNRLDLRDSHVRAALRHGCKIAINTDAHGVGSFDHLIYGVLTARRGGLRREDCINAWDAGRLRKWLG